MLAGVFVWFVSGVFCAEGVATTAWAEIHVMLTTPAFPRPIRALSDNRTVVMKQTRKELAVNMLNLLQTARDAIFPAIMFVLMALGTLVTSPKAEVLNPNDVSISSSQWAETSPDSAKVTVKDALSNSENSDVVAGVTNTGAAPYLNLSGSDSAGSIWWPSNDGGNAEIKLKIKNASGTVTGNCTVSSKKGPDGKFETTCQ